MVGVNNLALTARKFPAIKTKGLFLYVVRGTPVAATPERKAANEVPGGHQSNRSDYLLYTRRYRCSDALEAYYAHTSRSARRSHITRKHEPLE
jgi:hypothetical protein